MREISFCYKRPREMTMASQSNSSSSLVKNSKVEDINLNPETLLFAIF